MSIAAANTWLDDTPLRTHCRSYTGDKDRPHVDKMSVLPRCFYFPSHNTLDLIRHSLEYKISIDASARIVISIGTNDVCSIYQLATNSCFYKSLFFLTILFIFASGSWPNSAETVKRHICPSRPFIWAYDKVYDLQLKSTSNQWKTPKLYTKGSNYGVGV